MRGSGGNSIAVMADGIRILCLGRLLENVWTNMRRLCFDCWIVSCNHMITKGSSPRRATALRENEALVSFQTIAVESTGAGPQGTARHRGVRQDARVMIGRETEPNFAVG